MKIIDKYLIVLAIILMLILFVGAIYTRYTMVNSNGELDTKTLKVRDAVSTLVTVTQLGSGFLGGVIIIRALYLSTLGKAILNHKIKKMTKNDSGEFNGLENERINNQKIVYKKNTNTLLVIAFALLLLVVLVQIMKGLTI